MAVHTPVGIVAAAFVVMCQEKKNFPALLSRRLPTMTPLLAIRIGGIINFLADKGITDPRAVSYGVTGDYPHCRPAQGDWNNAIESVRNQLQALMIPVGLDAAMTCVVGIQNDLLKLGFDKIIGAASQTVQSSYAAVEAGTKYAGYGQQGYDKGKKLLEFRAALAQYRGDPVDLFVSIM